MSELSPERRKLLEMRLKGIKPASAAAPAGPALVARPRDGGPMPVSFAQQRLWLLDRLTPGTGAYNLPWHVRLRGELDRGALERAVEAIRERHEALRTVFAEREGEPVQVVRPYVYAPLATVDLRGLPEGEREAEAERLAHADANDGFDLAEAVFRAGLIVLADDHHVLTMTAHHIATDGWSVAVMASELQALYLAFREGRPNPLAPLPLQYADFSAWQREHLSGATLERHLKFWRDTLAGAPAVVELPTDRPRPPVESHRGDRLELAFPPALGDRIRELARAEQTTLFPLLLGAFHVVLARHAGQDSVVVGTPIANRTRKETEGLIGFFANTLALRGDVGDDPTFRALLRRQKTAVLDAFTHQDLPFERVVEELKVARDTSRNPLFQVMFALQNAGDDQMRIGGLSIDPAGTRTDYTKFDLTVDAFEEDGVMKVAVQYATDLFDAASASAFALRYRRFLQDAVADPDRPVSRIAMMDDEERDLVVSGWNATSVDYDGPATLPALFAARAAETPDADAVSFAGESLTYAELDARANRLAHHLRALGAGPDARVGVCLDRSVDMAVAVLAALKAGGCYVALDPGYPEDRLRYMLEDSRAAVLVTRAEIADRLPIASTPVVRVDADRAAIDAQPSDDPEAGVSPENLGYVLYTSGSTGRPKGVALPQRSLVNLVRWQTAKWAGEPPAATLQFASLSFDVSFQELFATWASGGRVVLVDEETRRDADALLRYLAENGVERLFLPFAALQHVAEAAQGRDLGDVKLREIVTAGEQLQTTPAVTRFVAATGARLENQYGPTEAHVVSAHPLSGDPAAWPALPPIGAPIANDRLYVLDRNLDAVPVGVPGELYIAGAGLARSYLDRPALTAERFVPSPFGPAGARMYRTGDRARWLDGGALQYLGRADDQVKVRGFRVELGEVESVVRQHPGVRDAAVAVRDDRLVAYVVGDSVDSAELKAFARGRLPDFMVPGVVVPVDALPLTPSGKLDRRALPAPSLEGAAAGGAPATESETLLAAIWGELLGVARIGRDDDFFELGGHSLVAVRLLMRLREAFGVALSLRAVFEAPTLAAQAAAVDAARDEMLARLLDELETLPDDEVPAAAGRGAHQ
ncbi:MAG TPA: amino acid adenylation domain-containing protein [Longimicrobium sp.]|nr:amino acid adenylation domain-containing protein [Longimicrobium sp.]